MKHKTGLRKRKSLCEKSMVLVANIIKLSSVYLGQMNLGTTSSFTSMQPSAAAYSDHKITRVDNSTSTTCAAKKVSLDVESPQSRTRSQKKPQEPAAAAAAEKDHQAFTTVITPSFVHVKPDHRALTEDVNDRADDFIRRKRQIIKTSTMSTLLVLASTSTSTTTASKGLPPYST